MNTFGAVIPLYIVLLHDGNGAEITLLKTTSYHEATKCVYDFQLDKGESISIEHCQILQSGGIAYMTREWLRK